MIDFVRLGSKDEFLIRRHIQAIPGFADAPEYLALAESDKRLRYIVAARAGDYWERLERDEQRHLLNGLSEGLESLASEADLDTQDLVLTIMNPLTSDSPVAVRMRLRLGPHAKALFEQFL